MIRVVALRKAAVAGAAGAFAWELVLRSAILLGIPTFDIVRILGTLAFPRGPALAWWSVGMVAHALVGVCWAVFYAYFFWSQFDWKPPFQGLVFSVVPAVLALFVVSPQLGLIELGADQVRLTREHAAARPFRCGNRRTAGRSRDFRPDRWRDLHATGGVSG